MKTRLLLTCLCLSGLASVSYANEQSNSHGLVAEVWGGANFLNKSQGDADDDDIDPGYGLLGGKASMIFGSTSNMTQVSFEGQSNFLSSDLSDDDQMSSSGQGTVHFMDDSGFGVLAGGGTVAFQDDDSVGFYFAGVEYKHHLNGGNVLVQVGGLDSEVTDSTDQYTIEDAWFIRAEQQLALNDSVTLGLNAAFVDGDNDFQSNQIFNIGFKLQQKFENSPMAVFLAYDGIHVDGAGGQANENSIMLGLRMDLGGNTNNELSNPSVARWVGFSHRTD